MPQTPEPADHGLIGGLLFVTCPALPLVAGLLLSGRSALPFAAALIVHLLALVFVVRRILHWLRPGRRTRPADYGFVAGALAAEAVTLVLVLSLADAYGIRGSALPRLLYADPMPADLLYLPALFAILATTASVLGLLVVLVRAHLSVGSPRPGS